MAGRKIFPPNNNSRVFFADFGKRSRSPHRVANRPPPIGLGFWVWMKPGPQSARYRGRPGGPYFSFLIQNSKKKCSPLFERPLVPRCRGGGARGVSKTILWNKQGDRTWVRRFFFLTPPPLWSDNPTVCAALNRGNQNHPAGPFSAKNQSRCCPAPENL